MSNPLCSSLQFRLWRLAWGKIVEDDLHRLEKQKRLYGKEFIMSFLKLLQKTEFIDRLMEICNE